MATSSRIKNLEEALRLVYIARSVYWDGDRQTPNAGNG